MQILKALTPLIIFTLLALYLRYHFASLSQPIIQAMQFLPLLLLCFSVLIAIHFSQTRILLFIIIAGALYYVTDQQLLDNKIKHVLFSTSISLLILTITLIKEYSVFSIKSLPVYLLCVFTVLLSLWLIREQPQWLNDYLIADWLPWETTNFSKLTHTTLVTILIVLLMLMFIFFQRKSEQSTTAIALLVMVFISKNFSLQVNDFIILISTVLLLCIFSILQESWKMAYLDDLTQLPGRRALTQKLRGLVGLYSIAMVDIDFFKKFNDKYGHDIGDLALKKVATALKKTNQGSVYRYGGEEFTIVFTNKSVEQCMEPLEKLRQQLHDSPFELPKNAVKTNTKRKIPITISIGVSDSIGHNKVHQTMKHADDCLYKAKKKGRNRTESNA